MGEEAMSETVEFKFKLYQKVRVEALRLDAIVVSRLNNKANINEYSVVFWSDNKRQQEWVYEWEIYACP